MSGINYAVFPGMLTFLSDDSGVLFLTSAYYVTNLFGRWAPTFYKVHPKAMRVHANILCLLRC